MSRSVAPHDPAEKDFAAFLERLTGHSGPETAEQDSGVYFTSSDLSGKAPNAASSALSSGNSKSRRLAPAKELKAGRGASALDAAELSYEKALRIHARHRSVPDDDLPQVDPLRVASPKGTATPNGQPETAAGRSGHPKPTDRIAQAQNKRKAKSSELSSHPASHSSSFPSTSKSMKLSTNRGRRLKEKNEGKCTLEPLRHELQLDQRRAVVSVRLTEAEIAQLRDRANESGISVSAYMRSCVLDAELLRAQVKQALAEMRAYGATPDHDSFPALAASGNTGSVSAGAWYRSLLSSASLLLGSLFAFRRSA
jgi:mobilization protein NikA